MADREPCPQRIIDDVGGAYAFGLAGGSIWHLFKGYRNAPQGAGTRGAINAIKARAPVLGGNFAVWGGWYAVFDCTLVWYRQKEDPWNAILSGAATGGLLAARAGPKTAAKNALVGGLLLAAIEGLGIVMTKMAAQPPVQEEEAVDPSKPGRPRNKALMPPIAGPQMGAASSYNPLTLTSDYDSSAPASSDITTGRGFDTDTRYQDTAAQDDPYAFPTGTGFGAEQSTGAQKHEEEKRPWWKFGGK